METKNLAIFVLALIGLTGFVSGACNDCSLQVIPVANSVCAGEPALFDLELTNIYDAPKEISLSAEGDVAMKTNMSSAVMVDAYGTKVLRTSFSPSEYPSIGEHRLRITAEGYGVLDSDDALFYVNDCHAAGLTLSSDKVSLCQDAVGRVDVLVSNTGDRKDTYSVGVGGIPKALKVTLGTGTFVLAPGESRTFSLTIEALNNAFGDYDLSVSVDSQSGKTVKRNLGVSLTNCYRVKLDAPEEFKTCPSAGLSYTVTLKNGGCAKDNYEIEVAGCGARVSKTNLDLAPGEETEIIVSVPASAKDCVTTVFARSEYDVTSASTHVRVLDCYDVDIEIIPGEVSACRGEPIDYILNVTNTGFYADSYSLLLSGLNVNLDPNQIYLTSEESKQIPFTMWGLWCVPTDDASFYAFAKGQSSDKAEGKLHFITAKDGVCSGLELMPSIDSQEINCDSGAYEFYVKNTGYTIQEVVITSSSDGVTIQPQKIKIQPYEARPIAAYITHGTTADKITISAESEDKRAFLELEINETNGVCTVSRPKAPEESVDTLLELPEGSFGIDNSTTNNTVKNNTTGAAIFFDEKSVQLIVVGCIAAVTLALLALILRPKKVCPAKVKKTSHSLEAARRIKENAKKAKLPVKKATKGKSSEKDEDKDHIKKIKSAISKAEK